MLQRTLPAGFIAPCLPSKTDKLPSGSEWLHDIKHDGFRVIARKQGVQVRLYSRPGNDLTYRFPLIAETLARLHSRSCIIDGETVACNDSPPSTAHALIWGQVRLDSSWPAGIYTPLLRPEYLSQKQTAPTKTIMAAPRTGKLAPVTLGHMRAHGCRDLLVHCNSGRCNHSTTMTVGHLADHTVIATLGLALVCPRCGYVGARVTPNWPAYSQP